MIDDKGIRNLVPGVVLPDEQKEIDDARKYIRNKLGPIEKLPAASNELISDYLPTRIVEKLPVVEIKDEFGFTKKENKEIEEYLTRDTSKSKGMWNAFTKADKDKNRPKNVSALDYTEQMKKKHGSYDKYYKGLEKFGIEESQVKHPDYPKISDQPILRNNINAANKTKVIIDSKHPDGFRFLENEDLYKNFKDTPLRYVQEVMYKYKDGAAPTDSVVKTFNNLDSSTFPSDPVQKKALAKYQVMYDKLSPIQKKQLDATKKVKV
jgi:hypothetical protein|tara:strand:+ start:798 stop:1592 length:795 start_codon:yes stop_codon:yes gene_type:complete